MNSPEAPASLLLIKPGSLGDIIHALPCAAAIRAAWPSTRLTWLVDERWQAVLGPCVSDTILFPRQKFRGFPGSLSSIPWGLGLGRLRPEIALDLQGLLRSALMAKLSGAKRIIGLSDAREGAGLFYSVSTQVDETLHSVRRYLKTLDALGIPIPAKPEFPLPAGTKPAGFPELPRFILLHPFARGSGKSVSQKFIAAFCRECAPYPVVIAGQGELQPVPPNGVDLLNKTSLREFLWLAGAARFVVSVDSGPMHMAAAITPELLSIHTWSDPRLVGPFSEKVFIWQGGEIRPQDLSPSASIGEARTPSVGDATSIAKWVLGRIN